MRLVLPKLSPFADKCQTSTVVKVERYCRKSHGIKIGKEIKFL